MNGNDGEKREQQENAKQLRQEGRFAEAEMAYRRLWDTDAADPWDGWGLAHCLRKLGRSAEALAVCDAVLRVDAGHAQTRSLAGWCLFDLHIRGAERVTSALTEALVRIRDLADASPGSRQEKYSPFPPAVFGAARLLDQADDYAGLVEWLKELDPSLLDASGDKAADGKEWASDREKWHLLFTKALDKLARWAELRDACHEALQAGVRFHNSQDVWVRFRLARADFRLGQGDSAAQQLHELVSRSPQPAILAGYAAVLVSLGRSKEAIPQYAQALSGARDLGMAVGWLSGLARCLEDVGELDLAALHLRLCVAVRQEKGWPIRGELQELAVRLGVSGEVDDSRSLARTLRPKWDEWQRQSALQMAGTVKTLLPNGKAGFIRGEDGVDYYFPLKDIRSGRSVAVGDGVEFEPYERFDPRKDQMSPAARHVQAIASSDEPF